MNKNYYFYHRIAWIALLTLLLYSCGDPDFPELGPEDNATIPIFPDAIGYGAFTHGGRGGEIIYVTTLEDSYNPGSLRYALSEAEGPRMVFFKVGGVFKLTLPTDQDNKDIRITNPYITVAGQTAPGDGVCIQNGGISIETHNICIQYIRIRTGDSSDGTDPEDRDALKILHGYNIMIDHVSASWAIDEVLSTWYKPSKITFQHCLIAEGLLNSLHPKGHHSRGLLIGDDAKNVTIYQNVFAHNNRRNPLIKGNTTAIDFVNNMVYNWGGDTGAGSHFSDSENSGPMRDVKIVGNVYIPGPDSNDEPIYTEPNFYRLDRDTTLYIANNWIYTGSDFQDAQEYSTTYASDYDEFSKYLVDTPAIPVGSEVETTIDSIYPSLLDEIGSYLPVRDAVDTRIIQDIHQLTGSIIDSPSEVGGYPTYQNGTPPDDTDGDGMPDSYEQTQGFDPSTPDGTADTDGDGYTNVETYLFHLSE